MAKKKQKLTLRQYVQILSLVVSGVVLGLIIMGFKTAIHAICPYASVCFGLSPQGFFQAFLGAFWITAFIGVLFLFHSLLYGRVFCGYICPLGTIQEAIFSFRTMKYKKMHKLPYFYERRFNKLKYAVLLVTMALAIFGIAYVFIRFCPFYALSQLPSLAIPGLLVFAAIIGIGLFYERFWCRFLCPYAGLLNLFQALGVLAGIRRRMIRRNLERCIDCGVCDINCPMNLYITEHEFVQDVDCIHCNECAKCCPKPGTICCEKEPC